MVGSLVVGITASIMGPSEKRPYLASSHALSRYSSEGLIMISECCGPSSLPGIAVRGKLGEREVDLGRRTPVPEGLELPDDPIREVLSAEKRKERGLGVGSRDDSTGLYAGTVSQGNAGSPAPFDVYGGDLGVGADLRPRCPGRGGYRLGD